MHRKRWEIRRRKEGEKQPEEDNNEIDPLEIEEARKQQELFEQQQAAAKKIAAVSSSSAAPAKPSHTLPLPHTPSTPSPRITRTSPHQSSRPPPVVSPAKSSFELRRESEQDRIQERKRELEEEKKKEVLAQMEKKKKQETKPAGATPDVLSESKTNSESLPTPAPSHTSPMATTTTPSYKGAIADITAATAASISSSVTNIISSIVDVISPSASASASATSSSPSSSQTQPAGRLEHNYNRQEERQREKQEERASEEEEEESEEERRQRESDEKTLQFYRHFYSNLLHTSSRTPLLRDSVGVANIGNSCYLGVSLQVLASLTPITQYFLVQKEHEKVLKRKSLSSAASSSSSSSSVSLSSSLSAEFGRVLHSLCLPSGRFSSINFPYDIKRMVGNLPNDAGIRFRGMMMQDAQEFLAVLLEALQRELNEINTNKQQEKKPTKKKTTPSSFDPSTSSSLHWSDYLSDHSDPISHLFSSQLAQFVLCSAGHLSYQLQIGGQLIINLPQETQQQQQQQHNNHLYGQDSYDSLSRLSSLGTRHRLSLLSLSLHSSPPIPLTACLSTLLAVDELTDYYCTECSRKTNAKTCTYYTHLPPILIIQLKRFNSGGVLKDERPCQYPLILDAGIIMKPQDIILKEIQKKHKIEDKKSSPKYLLQSVVLHRNNHYTVCCRVGPPPPPPSHYHYNYSTSRTYGNHSSTPLSSDGKTVWCYFNDSRSALIPESEVLSHQREVYLLVYQRMSE